MNSRIIHFRKALFLALAFLSSALAQNVTAAENKKIYFQGKETDYVLNDFVFFGDSKEPFYGGANDDYMATADQWVGLYADSPNASWWQRVIPDDSSVDSDAPWCSIQFFEKQNGAEILTRNEGARCVTLLATSQKVGIIPRGTKGTLLNYGNYYNFAPQIKHITLEGRFPEASRSFLLGRTVETEAQSVEDLRIMLNEIYARHGYLFKAGGEMDRYFRQQPWYRPRYTNVDALLTFVEYNNIKLLKELLSPETQRAKALYLANTVAFCKALEANDIKYVMDNTSEYVATGADEQLGRQGLEEMWDKYREIMVNGGGNCQRDIQSYQRMAFLYSYPINIYYNSSFDFDEEKGKYVMDYVNLDTFCQNEGDTVELEGLLTKRNHLIEDKKGQHMDTDIELKTIALSCVTGAIMEGPEWNRYVQLIIPPEKYKYYQRFVGKKITLRGKLLIARSMYHVTPVLLNLLEEDNPIIKVSDFPEASYQH